MDSRTPRLASKYALSLTTIASKLAPTEDHIRLSEQHYGQKPGLLFGNAFIFFDFIS
ncbi:hypothetical protein EMIT0P74_140185 [Pseudomonas sp. IT-P74]